MTKVLITGVSGTGKTTTITELASLGLHAYDADNVPGLCQLEIRATGQQVDWPKGHIDWDKYAYNINKPQLQLLLASHDPIFVGVVASNQAQIYDLFDYVFTLAVHDLDILLHRLKTRHAHQHGQTLPNLLRTVERSKLRTVEFIEDGAIAVDSTQPIDIVIKQILTTSHVNR